MIEKWNGGNEMNELRKDERWNDVQIRWLKDGMMQWRNDGMHE